MLERQANTFYPPGKIWLMGQIKEQQLSNKNYSPFS
jgi:hypothetical protein